MAVAWGTPGGRWVLTAAVLGSGIVFLDTTVVNVALPTIADDLDTGLAGLQWTINGYLLTLAAFILLGGALGDRYGRRRVFVVGVVWFAAASALCGLAPSIEVLVAARALQGVGGALLTPGSLALLQASFLPEDRSRAIGAWSGLGGVAAALGPFVGGWLVDAVSWRAVFLINLPVAATVVAVAVRHVPESRDPAAAPGLDVAGAVLCALGLAGVTWALIEGPAGGMDPAIVAAAVGGVACLVAFLLVESRSRHPMLPLELFSSHQFTAANVVTFAVYAALGSATFLLVLQLQTVLGYSPLEAGLALFPVTLLMLGLSARSGALATRIGPRLQLTAGPLLAGAGLLVLSRVDAGSSWTTAVLPGAVLLGLGLATTVAPLTSTVLAAASERHAGVASGVNNAVARAAGLVAVAVLPAVAGIGGDDAGDPAAFSDGFRVALTVAAALCAVGGALGWGLVRNEPLLAATAEAEAAGVPVEEPHTCGIDAPPLRRAS
ncbi:MAG TPA: DHA2 family efflux MFS transporter permease subunit [Acidimicrobiales bacterium]|nr:DHA2 family efflux MFS transporter permease subunit [Acidimicrobiales bacterium]